MRRHETNVDMNIDSYISQREPGVRERLFCLSVCSNCNQGSITAARHTENPFFTARSDKPQLHTQTPCTSLTLTPVNKH